MPTTLHEIDLRDRSDVQWSSMEGNGEDEGVNECMVRLLSAVGCPDVGISVLEDGDVFATGRYVGLTLRASS